MYDLMQGTRIFFQNCSTKQLVLDLDKVYLNIEDMNEIAEAIYHFILEELSSREDLKS
jgi:hypothetical protein